MDSCSGGFRPSDKGGGSHTDPEIWGGGVAGLQKNFFWLFGPQFGLKIKGEWAPPLDPLMSWRSRV